jgi:hypothetical protein
MAPVIVRSWHLRVEDAHDQRNVSDGELPTAPPPGERSDGSRMEASRCLTGSSAASAPAPRAREAGATQAASEMIAAVPAKSSVADRVTRASRRLRKRAHSG